MWLDKNRRFSKYSEWLEKQKQDIDKTNDLRHEIIMSKPPSKLIDLKYLRKEIEKINKNGRRS